MTSGSLPDRMLRAGLTLAFLYFGLTKLLGASSAIALYEAMGFGQVPRYITGTVETLSAILLWVPGLVGWAALALTGTMGVAIFAMVAFVGWAWWHLALLGMLTAVVAWTWRGDVTRHLGRATS